MDRSEWVQAKRHQAEELYDTLWAPTYIEKWGTYPNTSHQQFIQKFMKLLPPQSIILDAACGAGRYMPFLLEQGHTVIGIDQSRGMLARVKEKLPNVQVEKIGLQEISFQQAFDGAICMDALEHVCPEDWLGIFGNFQRALKPQGHLYFTVEIIDPAEVEQAYIKWQKLGVSVVYGELPEQDEVYHYYPPMGQVRAWCRLAGFNLVEEGEGDGYHHFVWQLG